MFAFQNTPLVLRSGQTSAVAVSRRHRADKALGPRAQDSLESGTRYKGAVQGIAHHRQVGAHRLGRPTGPHSQGGLGH